MKILLTGDLHIHGWKRFGIDSTTGISKRLLEQEGVLYQIFEVCLNNKIEAIIIAGDLLHKNGDIPVEALNVLFNFLHKLESIGVIYYLGDGNHDLIKKENPHKYHSAINLFGSFPSIFTLDNYKVRMVNFSEKIKAEDIFGFDLVLLHKMPIGSKMGTHVFEKDPAGIDWQTLAKNNKWAIFGHNHQPQVLSENCFVLGSPMHLTFADEGEHGVYILDTKTDKIKFIKLNYPKFLTVETSKEAKQDGNYYRVLNATDNISDDRVIINIVKPKFYEERLKGNNLYEILDEWLLINNKDKNYLEVIKDIIDEKLANFKKVFKGKIIKVVIKNYLTIKDISYSIENGFTLIKGENGSGKTNLFDCIYWCFYGKTTKELTLEEVIRWGAKETSVEVFLEGPQGGVGKVVRTTKEGLHVYKSISDEDPITKGFDKGKRQQLLEESLLGISEETFLSSCYFSQENLQMLTQLGDTDKTNLISILLGFDIYCRLYDKCSDKIKQLVFDKQIAEQEIKRFNSEVNKNESNVEIYKKQQNDYNKTILESKKLIDSYEEIILKMAYDISHPSSDLVIEKIVNYDEKILNLDSEIINIEDKLRNFKEGIDQSNKQINNNSIQYWNLKKDIDYCDEGIGDLKEEITNLKNIKIGAKCDRCGSIIFEENREIFIKEKEAKINELENKKSVILKEQTNIQIKIDKETINFKENSKFQKEYQNKLITIRDNIKILNNKKFEQSEKQRLLENKRNGLIGDQKEYNNNIKLYKIKISECEDKIAELDNNIKKLKIEIEDYLFELNKLNTSIICIDEDKIKLEFWKEGFSARGIKSLLLDKFCNEFNIILSNYIASVFNNKDVLSIILNPTKVIKSGESRNELNLEVVMLKDNQEKRCNYKNLSGGQKRKTDVSLCFTLNRWISNKYNVPNGLLGLIILDEIFSFVDSGSEESLAALIYEEGKNKAIEVISHTPNLESYAQRVWEVVLQDEVTKII
jgi:DNA repair exonuclease SbcCD ATPase subunit/DNA repair exonuclease SbcCD nuclease subunit